MNRRIRVYMCVAAPFICLAPCLVYGQEAGNCAEESRCVETQARLLPRELARKIPADVYSITRCKVGNNYAYSYVSRPELDRAGVCRYYVYDVDAKGHHQTGVGVGRATRGCPPVSSGYAVVRSQLSGRDLSDREYASISQLVSQVARLNWAQFGGASVRIAAIEKRIDLPSFSVKYSVVVNSINGGHFEIHAHRHLFGNIVFDSLSKRYVE